MVKSSMRSGCHTAIGKQKIHRMISLPRQTKNSQLVIHQTTLSSNHQRTHFSINTDNSNSTLTSPNRETSFTCYGPSLRIRRKTSPHGILRSRISERPYQSSVRSWQYSSRPNAKTTRIFQEVFIHFHQQCQASINPNLSIAAVEEMLIQHLPHGSGSSPLFLRIAISRAAISSPVKLRRLLMC